MPEVGSGWQAWVILTPAGVPRLANQTSQKVPEVGSDWRAWVILILRSREHQLWSTTLPFRGASGWFRVTPAGGGGGGLLLAGITDEVGSGW